MSSIQKHGANTLRLIHCDRVTVGAIVKHWLYEKTIGIVISFINDEALVLWTVPPMSWPFANHINSPRMIMDDLLYVQPMSDPSADVFYIDYVIGSGSMPSSGSV
jgi:hypothetical protein